MTKYLGLNNGQLSEFQHAVSSVGFVSSKLCTISFNDTNRTITLIPVSVDFSFYQNDELYTKTTDSLQLPDSEGLFIVYYNLGALAYVLNPDYAQIDVIIKNNPTVAYVYWNFTDKKSEYIGNELHSVGIDSNIHAYLHSTLGTRYLSGLDMIIPAIDSSGADDADAQFDVNTGAFRDEDIYFQHSVRGYSVGFTIAYLSGTTASPKLRTEIRTGYSVLSAGTGRLAFNDISGGNHVLSEANNGGFVLCHLIAVNENTSSKRIIAFTGQSQYTNITSARNGALSEIKSLDVIGILPQEAKIIATLIFETSNSYINAVKARIRTISNGVNFVDWRTTYLNGSSSGAVSGTQLNSFNDSLFQIINNIDLTKIVKFDVSSVTSGNTRTVTYPNRDLSLAQPIFDKLSVGTTNQTAYLTLNSGGSLAGTAPIRFYPGTGLTTPEDGALEYHGSHFYFTIGSTRYQLDQQASSTISVVEESTDTSCYVCFFTSLYGSMQPRTSSLFTFNSSTGSLATNNIIANVAFLPDTNNGASLGTTLLQFSGLFLAEGASINWDNGDVTLTQSGDVLTLAGAELKITTPGNTSSSVLTTDAIQTVTNKTVACVEIGGSVTGNLSASDCRGTIINNYGQASATITKTLPVAEAGLNFVAICGSAPGAYQWKIKANTSDKIYLNGTAGTDNQSVIVTPTIGNYITFATFKTGASTWDWIATTGSGSWTAGA